MKQKYFAILMSVVLIMSLLCGCSKDNGGESESTDSNIIYGEVSAVSTDSITIKIGTMNSKDMMKGESQSLKFDNESDSKTADTASESDNESDLETTDKTAESANESNLEDTDTTSYTENKTEKDEEQTQMQDGGKVQSMLELTGEEKTIKITDDTVFGKLSGGFGQQNPPEMPSGESGQQNPPETPSGESGRQTPPEMPSGESGRQTPPEMPSGMDEKGGLERETEEISMEDINEGDIISIVLDDNGNVKEITVIMSENN